MLSILFLFGILVGCGGNENPGQTGSTNPEEEVLDPTVEKHFEQMLEEEEEKNLDTRTYPKYPLQDGKGLITSPKEPETARSNN